jgi:hypothetical protein
VALLTNGDMGELKTDRSTIPSLGMFHVQSKNPTNDRSGRFELSSIQKTIPPRIRNPKPHQLQENLNDLVL